MYEAVIVDVARTAIGRRKGMLSGVHPVDLLGMLFKEVISRNGISAEVVDDVIVGCVMQAGEQALNIGRNAWLSVGLPESVPATTVDRQCGSSLQALHFAAQGVMAGVYDVVIAAGVESMTRVPMGVTVRGIGSPKTQALTERYNLGDHWFSQAVGAEMIAKQWGFRRSQLDAYSLRSHQFAYRATAEGAFDGQIVPITVADASGNQQIVRVDEGIRPTTSLEKLAELQPAFENLDLITAGNSSQISDGASAVLVMSREAARRYGLRPRARFVSFSVVGDDPVKMLTGPIPATKKALAKAGLVVDDIDLFEVNEAFAPVVLAWQQETGADWDKVNVNGGAIALGHPLGATGTRIVATLVSELERRQQRFGLAAICEGGGTANATVLERVSE
ncbi:thiolase family protein [Alicyclobacillus mengziensis]|uniref:Thiolase family protein n=1 Tax=Alicyclobacillus mengziensis TaxID=2931921 RepID=A0A9X7W246_9BACL|nr:thiolase family protein [Alicyclobacillus mengziensis]QSO48944.1 thiolase family protein [Alicyclobacillus mengziensis]